MSRLDGVVAPDVNLVVPLKRMAHAKTRLAGALDPRSTVSHGDLVRALAYDTVAAALATPGVRRVLIVAAEPDEVSELADLGAEVVGESGFTGLNSALRHGDSLLRSADPGCVVGALHADLPALSPAELAGAVREAAGSRAFCADRHGTGTTLLLSAAGAALDPRFGPGSAAAHASSGARPLQLAAPSLRADVDTAADLAHACGLGLGPRTRAVLCELRRAS
ncbi:MAG: 2-phospho-L-lactate guanylyltransferase [Haloechinothrix sp.]